MTTTIAAAETGAVRWTCPFCPLLCDHLSVQASASGPGLQLAGGDCARARAALARHGAAPAGVAARVDGVECDLDSAIAAAARLIAAGRQPLFGGLDTDVAGARSLYRLACRTGAICDAGEGLMHGQRALQDRGGYTATLTEVRARADLVVLLDTAAFDVAPNLAERLGLGGDAGGTRRVVVFGPGGAAATLAGHTHLQVETLPYATDLHTTVAMLAALVAGRRWPGAPVALAALAEALHAARYAVIVGAAGSLPAHGALVVEAVGRIVGTLNATTRAAALWIGAGAGPATANQVFTWLSGLPLRSRAGPRGLEHDPVCHATARLLDDDAVDVLLWIASIDAAAPPPTSLPLVVLGHPALAPACDRAGSVYIPVSTPGIGSAGHLFRTDGVVLLPLFPVYADTLPRVSDVLDRIAARVGR
jgi:formylmethanofuran dehydrogenase subunit B